MSVTGPLVEGTDYYVDSEGLWIFTASFLARRGFCCHQGCRHCPYEVIPRLRSSPLVMHKGALLAVRLRDPIDGRVLLFPPGGGIETGENPADAAKREALEETGYHIEVDLGAHTIVRYPFRWAGKEYDCTTHFYIASLSEPAAHPEPRTPQEVEFLVSIEWIGLNKVPEAFAHHPLLAQTISAMVSPRR